MKIMNTGAINCIEEKGHQHIWPPQHQQIWNVKAVILDAAGLLIAEPSCLIVILRYAIYSVISNKVSGTWF